MSLNTILVGILENSSIECELGSARVEYKDSEIIFTATMCFKSDKLTISKTGIGSLGKSNKQYIKTTLCQAYRNYLATDVDHLIQTGIVVREYPNEYIYVNEQYPDEDFWFRYDVRNQKPDNGAHEVTGVQMDVMINKIVEFHDEYVENELEEERASEYNHRTMQETYEALGQYETI